MTNKKVLIVDDEMLLGKSTQLILKVNGFEVELTNEGQAGLDAAEKHQPHLILLDVMMPGMDGISVLEKLKKNDKTKDIPVVIFTAKEITDDLKAQLEAAADFIGKPFEADDLISTLKKHIYRSE